MARRRPSLAERFRANRASFALSLELGCTPAEAEAELARRAAWARAEQSRKRLAALDTAAAHRAATREPTATQPAVRRWWLD